VGEAVPAGTLGAFAEALVVDGAVVGGDVVLTRDVEGLADAALLMNCCAVSNSAVWRSG